MPSPNLTEQISAHIKTTALKHDIDLEAANTYHIITFKPKGTTHAIRTIRITPERSPAAWQAIAFFTLLAIPCLVVPFRKECDEEWSSWEAAAFSYAVCWLIFLQTEILRAALKSVFARAVCFGAIMVGSCVFAGAVTQSVPVCDG
ncbi:hypothetical protein PRZ48_012837 [Zasmidium cellare]|uniref:Uncharacterized protein n=1 Tax=Zasmidium cellare TaxID=395010 RepID=A0ABR0E2L1_ZASCE|nr:hypothetical protein PRZ48_012837 [Zasmidium cellare]